MSCELVELLAPGVTIQLGRIRWQARFSHRVLLKLEELSGLDVMAGKVNPWRPSTRVLRALLVASYGSDELPWELLTPKTIPKVLLRVQEAWRESMPEPDPSRGEESRDGSGSGMVGGWVEAWANAHTHLGLSGEEWLEMTPRMIQALSRQRLELVRQREWMLGQVCATVANFSMGSSRDPLRADLFMLHPWKDLPDPFTQSVEDVLKGFISSKMTTTEDKLKLSKLLPN